MKSSLIRKKSLRGKRLSFLHLVLFSFLVSLLFQLICSRSSPLYPMNDWVDVDCFFTVGKSVLNGKVLYRDIYEQKGPLLYFIYTAAAILSDSSFIGPFIIHTIAMGLFLFFSARIIELFSGSTASAFLSVPILALMTHTTKAFVFGGSTEELIMWMLSATLYIIARAIKEGSFLKKSECLVFGLFAGIALYVKFTFLGFYLGIALFVLIWHIHARRFKQLFINIAAFLTGILLLSMPVFFYFGIHDAIPDFIRAYFYNNIFLYTYQKSIFSSPILNKIAFIGYSAVKAAFANPVFFIAILLGMLRLVFIKPFRWQILLMVFLSVMLTAVGAFWGRGYDYYCLILAPFAAFGFCWIKLRPNTVSKLIICIVSVCALGSSFFLSENTYLMRYDREDLPQYRFAKQINEVENATLLNYGFLDGGFYHAAQIEPTCRFFCALNIPLPEMKETQDAVIDNGSVNFVVTRDLEIVSPNYTCIDSCSFNFSGKDRTYYLYRNNDIPES